MNKSVISDNSDVLNITNKQQMKFEMIAKKCFNFHSLVIKIKSSLFSFSFQALLECCTCSLIV